MADTFTLDTSGAVQATDAVMIATRKKRVTWDDIGALPYGQFAQGYIEAALRSLVESAVERAAWAWRNDKDRETDGSDQAYFRANWQSLPGLRAYVTLPAFHKLAPETLAAMLKDCEEAQASGWAAVGSNDPRVLGATLWKVRQSGQAPAFQPLRLFISEDGLVRQEVA